MPILANKLIDQREKCLIKLSAFLNAIDIMITEDNIDELNLAINRKNQEIKQYIEVTTQLNKWLKKNSNLLTIEINKIKKQEENWSSYLIKEKKIIAKTDNVINKMKNTSKKINIQTKILKAYL